MTTSAPKRPPVIALSDLTPPRLPMKLGVIDLGSNSVHLMIFQVWEDGSYTVLHQERTQVRLGAPVFEKGLIDPHTESIALAALQKFISICRNQSTERILLVGTSPLREAGNAAEVLERILHETGLEVYVIPGREEARLTALAATDSVGIRTGKVLVVDVGGGTTELAWLEEDVPLHLWSLQHAPLRLLGQLALPDPPGSPGLEELRVLTRKAIGPLLRAKLGAPDWTLATSGTAVCLGELCGTRERAATALEIRVVFRAALKNLLDRLAEMDLARRRDWLGGRAERADTILAGGMIFLTILEELGVERMITGCKALRTGIVLDYLEHNIRSTARDHSLRLVQLIRDPMFSETSPDLRAHNIVKLARRYGYEPEHSNRVMELADLLFEGLESLYLLGEEDRFYLQAAALLHDIGYYINSTRHHHHSQYLILHSEIEGFHQMEIRTIACLARYHSRELPGAHDPEYMALPEGMRRKVDLMAGILRIADALDFTHQGLVRDFEVETSPETVKLLLSARGPIHLEVQEANLKGNLLAKALGRRLEIEVQVG